MIFRPRKRCQDCSNLAIYGPAKIRIHCELHRTANERNLIERTCKSCQLDNILDANDLCEYCTPTNVKLATERKEMHVRELLRQNGLGDAKFDQIPNGTACGRERPDCEYELKTHVVILEVDENQHKSYTCECEQIRMVNLSHTYGGKPVFWIRYNPDEFKLPDGTKATITLHKREEHLLEWVRYARERIPEAFVEVVHLFYDGCPTIVAPSAIVPVLAWDAEEEANDE
jgi:hypothetical protein